MKHRKCAFMLTKRKAQLEGFILKQLNFIWGKMRTAAQETAPQIALRDCCKEAVEEGQYTKL